MRNVMLMMLFVFVLQSHAQNVDLPVSDVVYHRELAGIYGAASGAAAQLAASLESPRVASASANPALAHLRQQLDEARREEAALQSGATPADPAQLEELKSLEPKLQQAITMYEQMPTRASQLEAAALRQMQTRFATTNQTFLAAVDLDTAECITQRQILSDLAQADARQPQIKALNKLDDSADRARPGQPASAGATNQKDRAEIQSLQTQLKTLEAQLKTVQAQTEEYDQILSSIPALKQRLNQLLQKEANTPAI